ncbi:MAG: 5-dehydro-2-deoxygluconokinase [Proteobacteria bacterium]|nr:5-dehydro-2-deoxygluconokinase [Pseudomonadota bacterium]MCH8278163.1 5-dehydro-2-deoxygluconokinase [Pseudomonadota bacterium]
MATEKALDIICLGRVAVDFYGDQVGGRLEDMQSFSKYLGGSSGNLAAGLARLGTKSSMLSRVGNEQMGRFVREALAKEGVDVSHVATDPDRLTALVVLGISDRNSFPHIFFRENCADLGIEKSDFDEAYIGSSRALAITGTHLSTEQSYEVVRTAINYAKKQGTHVVLDIDYRPVLWGLVPAGGGEERFIESALVTSKIQSVLGEVELLVGTEEEINIAGGSTDTLKSLRAIRELSTATIVLKRGPLGCSIYEGAIPNNLDDGISVRSVKVEVLNTLGAGDAFLSGFLSAWINGLSWKECAASGNACGALVVSRHGCTPAMPTRVELDDYLQRADSISRPDKDARINYLHAASTRATVSTPLMVLAFDHRRQLEDLAISIEPAAKRISEFKSLVCRAAEKIADERGSSANLGMIVDERYGEAVLARMTAKGWWLGRPVEVPASKPVEFDPRNNIGLPLLKWPRSHIVKCLVFYHPEDDLELRLQQEERVRELHADCGALGRELLLEIISSKSGRVVTDSTVPNVLRRFYNLGVFPAWWKLESQSDAAWQELSGVIEQYDPLCRGVLMLGLDAPEKEIKKSFRVAGKHPICKGFAVGRSIFGESARQWFNSECDDDTVIRQVADNYRTMIKFWQESTADVASRD